MAKRKKKICSASVSPKARRPLVRQGRFTVIRNRAKCGHLAHQSQDAKVLAMQHGMGMVLFSLRHV